MKIHVIQNVSYEGPGTLLDWASANNAQVSVTRTDLGEMLPRTSDFDFLVLLGGPFDLTQCETSSVMTGIENLIMDSLEARKKILGICLGAQILAKTLGAPITKNPVNEIGWFNVDSIDPSLPSIENKVLHWHENTFALPVHAAPVYKSQFCNNQGFTVQESILALQFHPEWTQGIVSQLIKNEGSPKPSNSVQKAEEILSGDFENLKRTFFKILDSFVGGSRDLA